MIHTPTSLEKIASEAMHEVLRASRLYRKHNSPHEAYAILKEEVDEFWDEVKKEIHDNAAMRKELIQIAAMAMRTIHDLKLNPDSVPKRSAR